MHSEVLKFQLQDRSKDSNNVLKIGSVSKWLWETGQTQQLCSFYYRLRDPIKALKSHVHLPEHRRSIHFWRVSWSLQLSKYILKILPVIESWRCNCWWFGDMLKRKSWLLQNEKDLTLPSFTFLGLWGWVSVSVQIVLIDDSCSRNPPVL